MAERRSIAQKHTSGESPRCVQCAILPGRSRCGSRNRCGSRSRRGVRGRSPEPEPAARNSRGVLIDTSIYLEPTELVDVALYVLARLAPCLNLGVGELGHKDLLDTIGADNCRK